MRIFGVWRPNNRAAAFCDPAMKVAAVLFAVCCWLSAARCQYLETTILLPDTLGPLNGPYCLAWDDNPAHPRLYVGGEGDSGGVIVAEAITCKRLARIPTGPVKALCFVPPHGKLYIARAGRDSIAVVDCATNHVVSMVHVANEAPVLQYNRVNDRLYCGGDQVSVIDCAGDSVIHTVAVTATVFALDPANNKLYAGSNGPLSVIDCAGDSVVATIPRVDSAGALCYNLTAGKVYATSGDTLLAVDANHDSVVASLSFSGLGPILTCDPQRNRTYTYRAQGDQYYWSSIDCARDTVVLTQVMYQSAYSLACNVARDRLYYFASGYVAVIDGTTGQIMTTVVTQSTTGSEWSPGLDRIYCPPSTDEPPYSQQCLLIAVDGTGDSLIGILPLTIS